jgi:hypothetical protein
MEDGERGENRTFNLLITVVEPQQVEAQQHYLKSITYPQPSLHGSTLVAVAKKLGLAHMGSKRTAILRHTFLPLTY